MRPNKLHKGGTLYWTIRLYDSDGALADADSTPTVAVRKNGASVADAVTVTKRASTTGIYDCSYNPASEITGDVFTMEETATITDPFSWSWSFTVVALPAEIAESLERENGPLDKIAGAYDADNTFTQAVLDEMATAVNAGTGLNAVTINVEDAAGTGVEGARVSIVDTTKTLPTGSAGQVVFNLDGSVGSPQTYDVRVSAPTGYDDPGDTEITVPVADPPVTITLASTLVTDVTRDEVYAIYGRTNIRSWADLDSDGVAAKIDGHIDSRVALATEYTLSRMRKGWDLDAALESLVVRDIIARIAGLDVYNGRGYDNEEDKGSMSKHRKYAEDRLKQVAIGQVRITGIPPRGVSAPNVVTDE